MIITITILEKSSIALKGGDMYELLHIRTHISRRIRRKKGIHEKIEKISLRLTLLRSASQKCWSHFPVMTLSVSYSAAVSSLQYTLFFVSKNYLRKPPRVKKPIYLCVSIIIIITDSDALTLIHCKTRFSHAVIRGANPSHKQFLSLHAEPPKMITLS